MSNLKRSSLISLAGIALLVAILAIAGFAQHAKANALDMGTKSSAAATTTVTYFTTTTATTTLITYDSFANGDPNAFDKLALSTQFAASSTASVLSIYIQYSQDGIDWYDNNTTSTSTGDISGPIYNTWTAAGTATSSKIITVNTPTRFTRVNYAIKGASGAVWAQFISQKQQP